MNDFVSSSSLGSIGQPQPSLTEQKQQEVAAASERNQSALGGMDLQTLGVAIREGNDVSQDPLAQDLMTLSPIEVEIKYGADVAAQQVALRRQMSQIGQDQNAERNAGQIIGDATSGVTAAAIQGIGGLGAMGAGLIDADAGAVVSEAVNTAAGGVRSLQSNELQRQKELGAIRGNLDARDIAARFEEDRKTGAVMPGLQRFGREILAAGTDLIENPALAGDLTAEGVGSLAGSAGIGGLAARGTAKLALRSRGITGKQANEFLASAQGRAMMTSIAEKGVTPASIGLQEAGGAYSQIQQEIQEMSPEELGESPEYQRLIEQGLSHEEARNQLANAAGLEGGAIQGIIGLATGTLVSKFESAPLSAGTGRINDRLARASGNLVREGVEEASQEASAGIVSNVAIERQLEDERDIFEGAGTSAVQGAVGGVGTAGAVQAPGVALSTTKAAAQSTANAVSDVVKNRVASVDQEIEEGNASSTANLSTATQASANLVSTIQQERAATTPTDIVDVATPEAVETPQVVEPEAAPEQTETEVGINDILSAVTISQGELKNTSEAVTKLFPEASFPTSENPEDVSDYRINAIQKIAETVEKGELDDATRNEASLWLATQVNAVQRVAEHSVEGLTPQLVEALQAAAVEVDKVASNPTIAKAIKSAQNLTSADFAPAPEVTDTNFESPEVQRAIQTQSLLAQTNPTGVNPEFIEKVLSNKKIKFSDRVMKSLKVAGAIAREANATTEKKAKIAAETDALIARTGSKDKAAVASEAVRRQINYEGRNAEKGQLGLSTHQSNIVSAIERGNMVDAQAYMDNLRQFGQSMVNKLNAARASYDMRLPANNKVYYDVWDGSVMVPGGGKVGISPFSPRSVQLGKDISIDAASVARVYNMLLETYEGELKGEPLATGKEVVVDEEISLIEDDEPEVAPQETEPKPEPKPEPKTEPKSETPKVIEDESSTKTKEPVEQQPKSGSPATTTDERLSEKEIEQERKEAADLAEKARLEEAEAEADRVGDEAAAAKEAAKPKFDNLAKDANGVNRFDRAIKVNPEKSILMQGEAPISGVVNILEDYDNHADDLSVTPHLDREKASRVAAFIRKHGVALAESMNARLNDKILLGNKMSGAEAVRQTKVDFTSFMNGKNLTIVDPETGQYDSRLLGAAVLAAIHWTLQEDVSKTPLKREDIAKIRGIDEMNVTPAMERSYNQQVQGNVAKESLAKTILQFWGAKTVDETTTSDTIGIAQGVAAELLTLMDGKLIIKENVIIGKKFVERKNKNTKKVEFVEIDDEVSLVKINDDEAFKKEMKALDGVSAVISEAFIPGAEMPRFIDVVPETKPGEKQKGNWLGRVSGKYTAALKRHRETKHLRNTQYVDLMKGLGEEVYVSLLGASEYDPEVTHVSDAESLDGKNKNLRRAYRLTLAHDEQVLATAAGKGKDPKDVATYYDYFVGSNGRIMAKNFNGQSDKTMREAYSPTRSELDLSDEATHDRFWIAVGQMSGVVKTELEFREVASQITQNHIFTKYPRSIEVMTEYARTGEVTEDLKEALKAEVSGAEPHLVHALLAVGKYAVAVEDGRDSEAAKNFETFLALEADGKTDGPFHAMMHFLSKPFSVTQLKSMRRGGLFPNVRDMTLNQFLRGDTKDDLYEAAADVAQKVMGGITNQINDKKDAKLTRQFDAVKRVMERLGGMEMKVDKNGNTVVTFNRGDLKNPLTVTIYGSSEGGIAGKLTAALEKQLYAEISKVLKLRRDLGDESIWFDSTMDLKPEELREFEEDLRLVFTNRIGRDFMTGEFYSSPKLPKNVQRVDILPSGEEKVAWAKLWLRRGMTSEDLKKYTLAPDNKLHLMESLKTTYVASMTSAIDAVTDNARDGTKSMMAASAIQSAVVKEAFKKAVLERVEEKRASGELSRQDQLSQADYKAIYKKVAPFAAVIETTSGTTHDAAHLNLNSAERGDLGFEVARSMDGSFRGEAAISGPSDAGVSAMPLVTISEGDAAMMVEYFANPENNPNAEQVFDGLNMPIQFIDEMSAAINEADAKAIMRNPLMNAADSFENFLQTDVMSFKGNRALMETVVKSYYQTVILDNPINDLMTDEDVAEIAEASLKALNLDLRKQALGAQARKDVLAGMGFSLDHMASGERPFNNDADVIDAIEDEALIEEMNKRYEARLEELIKEGKISAEQPAFEPANPALEKALLGLDKTKPGVKILSMPNLVAIMKNQKLSANLSQIFAALAGRVANDFKVVYGNSEEISAWRDRNFPPAPGEKRSAVELGMADLENRVIYIANAAHETVLHEMMHAAVGAIISDYYTDAYKDNELVDDLSKKAIRNLEKLMVEFMGLTPNFKDNATIAVVTSLQSQIASYFQTGTSAGKAAALNEFVAWTLTNQKLVDTLSKTKARSSLVPIIDKALKVIRRLLGLPNATTLDVFSNIKSNTAVLINQSGLTPKKGTNKSYILHQRSTDSHLQDLTSTFQQRVKVHLDNLTVANDKIEQTEDTKTLPVDLANALEANGVRLDATQRSAFMAIQSAFVTTMQIHRPSLVQAQKLYDSVIKNLTVEDLMDDPSGAWAPADRTQAEDLFNVITGKVATMVDNQDRSSRLATFLALSQVSPAFRKMLDNKVVPGKEQVDKSSIDERLRSEGRRMMDRLALSVAGNVAKNGTVKVALDRLMINLSKVEEDAMTRLEKASHEVLNSGDTLGSKLLSKAGDKMVSFAEGGKFTNRDSYLSQIEKTVRQVSGIGAALVNEERGKRYARAAISLSNEATFVPGFMKKLLEEVVGITEENYPIYKMINQVKTTVQQLRQRYRQEVPKIIEDQFSRKLSQKEWEALYQVLGKTDMAALIGDMGADKVLQLLQDPAKLKAELKKAEEDLKAIDKRAHSLLIAKSWELAGYMVTGKAATHNLLRNAKAVSMLLNESVKLKGNDVAKAEPIIDKLVSLMAISEAIENTPGDVKAVQDLLKNEKAGTQYVMNYLVMARSKELAKATTPAAKLNSYKGYLPSESREGSTLKIAPNTDHAAMLKMGYTKVGDYESAGLEYGAQSYYFSNVGSNATYNQGILQTVQKTAGGVDVLTGRSVTGQTGGLLPKDSVKYIKSRLARKIFRANGEFLLPIFNEKGEVVGYERSMNPKMMKHLQANRHLGEMLGSWAGRQSEEELAGVYNEVLVTRAHELWTTEQKAGRSKEFIDLSYTGHQNEAWKDAWEMIPSDTRDLIKEIFGDDGFMVRQDMIDNIVGFRSLSIGEAWTGSSNLPDSVKEAIKSATTAVMGVNAYKYTVTAEKLWQTGVSVAKQTIVIRSFIVPAANIASNVVQLLGNGVPVRAISTGFKTKLVEIDQYLKNQDRLVELSVEMAQHSETSLQYRKLENEAKSIDDADRRMSIWPLIENGEFATISEGLTDADAAIAQGKWTEWMQQKLEKIPEQFGTVGRYAAITQDTALFQGMSRSVQYGDFLAKAVLYDHLIKTMPKEKVDLRVGNEFVNYNYLPGRARNYTESMGLAWFWSYKLRSVKVAHRMMRDNPVRALLTSIGLPYIPEPLGISTGSPLDDNAVSVIADGRAGYSLGTGMLFRAPTLNPWYNLVN